MIPNDTASPVPSGSKRLAESAYPSPYSHAGAPTPHPITDPYAALRSSALCTLEAMDYEPKTMAERGVYMHFLGACFHRFMEGYDEFLSEKEYDDMIHVRTMISVIRRYEMDLRRQVKYPDSLIEAHRRDHIQPTRNNGTSCLFSLKQQAIVAQVRGSMTYRNVKTGRPIDIRTLGGGWPALYEGLTEMSERANALKEKLESRNPVKSKV